MACLIATTSGTSAIRFDQPITQTSSIHDQIRKDLDKMLRQQFANNRISASTIMIPILIRAFGPLPPILSFALPANATVAFILATIIRNLRLPARVAQMLRLTRLGGQNVNGSTPISSLTGPPVRNAYGQIDRKSTRLNSSHSGESRMPSSA